MATLIGAGVVLVDVVTFTLLQRAAPDDVLARVFGVLESAMRAALGIGAVAVPALVAATDLAITLAIVAAVQPIALVIAWPRLRAVDSIDLVPTERITLLQSVAMFAPLPALPLERLAARLVPHEAVAGETIIRQGDGGDVVYVIAAGTVDVSTTDITWRRSAGAMCSARSRCCTTCPARRRWRERGVPALHAAAR